MAAEPKRLSECGTEYVIEQAIPDKQDKYRVEIEQGDFLVIEAGAVVGKAAAGFKHPNVAATVKRVYNFRTYFKSGAKKWYEKAGVSHYFVVPRSAVTLLPEKGYSYVKAEINGVKVSFNVSGGGGGGEWTDYLRAHTQVSVNHPIRDLKKIAEVAVRGTPLEPIQVKPLEPQEEARWNQLATKAKGDVKDEVVALIEAGKKPIVKMLEGYSYGGQTSGEGIEIDRAYKMRHTNAQKTECEWKKNGVVRAIILLVGGYQVRVKLSQIDWYATAQANGLDKAA